ncbi:MAG: DNA repair exonuclease [Nanoarchaeota archaeon]|nr:DNA repair exonuclease [Nanoarchaeota archaeon]
MKFAHIADMHIGGWSDPKMTQLGLQTFKKALQICVDKKLDFILFAGDLFNSAMPQIDLIKEVAGILKEIKDHNIPIYYIAGSHDFSASGKSMLEVLEKAGLLKNVAEFDEEGKLKFTKHNEKIKITGLMGKKGGLDKLDYLNLKKKHLEEEIGFKIFMFHAAINEFKLPEHEMIEGLPAVALPNNFDYYAGGHIHYIYKTDYGNGKLTFPGALFPNNFKELEEYKQGNFYIIDENLNIENIPLKIKDVLTFNFDATNKTPNNIKNEIINTIQKEEVNDKIILLRIKGELISGKPSEINFKSISEHFENAYYIGKNIAKLNSKKFNNLKIEQGEAKEVETKLIQNQASNKGINIEDKERLTKELIDSLNKEKEDGEKNADFNERIFSEVKTLLNLNEIYD